MTINANSAYEKSVWIIRSIMNVIGLWPSNEKQSFFVKCQPLVPAFLICFFIVIPQTRKAIISRKDLNLVIEVLTTADIQAIALLKLIALWYNKRDLKRLVVSISNDWKETNEKEQIIMWKNAKLSRLIGIFCISSTSGSVFTYTADYFVKINTHENATKLLYLKSHFPFETNYSPVYQIINTCQFTGVFFSCFAFSSFDSFFVSSILHFSSQLYNLNIKIKNLVAEHYEQKINFVKVLEQVVLRHQHIVRFGFMPLQNDKYMIFLKNRWPDVVKHLKIYFDWSIKNSSTDMIEKNFNKVFLVQMCATSLALCMQGYQFVMVISQSGAELVTSLMFILVFTTGNVLSLFMYCYISEIIRNESKDLFTAVYEMEWYKLSPKEASLLLIIMNRLQSPIKITVGKFAVFSLEYFSSVVKTSVGYLSVLLAVRQKIVD